MFKNMSRQYRFFKLLLRALEIKKIQLGEEETLGGINGRLDMEDEKMRKAVYI